MGESGVVQGRVESSRGEGGGRSGKVGRKGPPYTHDVKFSPTLVALHRVDLLSSCWLTRKFQFMHDYHMTAQTVCRQVGFRAVSFAATEFIHTSVLP